MVFRVQFSSELSTPYFEHQFASSKYILTSRTETSFGWSMRNIFRLFGTESVILRPDTSLCLDQSPYKSTANNLSIALCDWLFTNNLCLFLIEGFRWNPWRFCSIIDDKENTEQTSMNHCLLSSVNVSFGYSTKPQSAFIDVNNVSEWTPVRVVNV